MSAFSKVPLSRILGYAAGGAGLAALENHFVGNNIPTPLKGVNLGLGAGTGAMLASHNPVMQTAALTSIPAKEMALFGLSGLDKFREDQQKLTDTNLHTARLNETAARVSAGDAGGRKALMAAFLLPALLGSGAAGAMAYMQYKKTHKPPGRFKTTDTEGARKPSQKIRIDIPQSALPHDFYSTLAGIDRNPRSFVRMQTKTASQHPAWDLIKNIAWTSTGIPNAQNALRDTGSAFNSAGEGDYSDARRYGVSGAANAALALLSLRFGAPAALRLFGRARIGGVFRNAMSGQSRQLTEFPWAAKFINRWGGGHELGPANFSQDIKMPGFASGMTTPPKVMGPGKYMNSPMQPVPAFEPRLHFSGADRMKRRSALGLSTDSPLKRTLDIRGRYDPQRYSFTNPTGGGPLFRALATNSDPRSFLGHGLNIGRYALNRGVNAGYAARQFTKRHPFLTGFAALPTAGAIGSVQDDTDRENDARAPHPWYADYSKNQPSGNYMPMSSMSSSLVGAFGGGSPMSPLQTQIRG